MKDQLRWNSLFLFSSKNSSSSLRDLERIILTLTYNLKMMSNLSSSQKSIKEAI